MNSHSGDWWSRVRGGVRCGYSKHLEVFVQGLGKLGETSQCKGTDVFT